MKKDLVYIDIGSFTIKCYKKTPKGLKHISNLSINFKKNYDRNKMLVSFDSIPQKVRSAIINSYVDKPQKDKSKLLNFFIEHKMKNMLELIEEF